jgi:hypothetical protein
VVVGVITGGKVEVVTLVDVVVAGASDEVEVEAMVVVDACGAVVLLVDEEPGPVEVVTDEEVDELLEVVLLDVVGTEVEVVLVEVADTEVDVVLDGSGIVLLVVVVDDEVGGTVLVGGVDVLVGTVDVLVDATVLEVDGTVELVLVTVVVMTVLAVVAEVEVGGGSVVSDVLVVVLVVVVANVPANPPIWITLSAGVPPKVVTKRSSLVRASNSSPSGPTPSSVAKTRSTGDAVPRVGVPDRASIGSPLAASIARTRSWPSSKLA